MGGGYLAGCVCRAPYGSSPMLGFFFQPPLSIYIYIYFIYLFSRRGPYTVFFFFLCASQPTGQQIVRVKKRNVWSVGRSGRSVRSAGLADSVATRAGLAASAASRVRVVEQASAPTCNHGGTTTVWQLT